MTKSAHTPLKLTHYVKEEEEEEEKEELSWVIRH